MFIGKTGAPRENHADAGRMSKLWLFWLENSWKPCNRNPTQNISSHIPNPHQHRKHSSWKSSSAKRQHVWGNSSSSSPSSLARCPLKIKGHLKLQPYFRMHNNSDTSGGECYLPHVVESSDVFLLLSALLTEDCDVLFSPAWKLNTQKKRLECYTCKCDHISMLQQGILIFCWFWGLLRTKSVWSLNSSCNKDQNLAIVWIWFRSE